MLRLGRLSGLIAIALVTLAAVLAVAPGEAQEGKIVPYVPTPHEVVSCEQLRVLPSQVPK